jgi:tetratricopeptide (TPR) repeat protein/predicted Ser/Thr protein kinase
MSSPPHGLGPHPELAELERHGTHPDDTVTAHLAECPACRALADELAALAALESELRVAVTPRTPATPTVPGYEDLRPLASGGQGVVWRARQSSTRRDVALKVLYGASFASERSRARFEREVELAAALRHPGLVTVFDSGETPDGAAWFAMEYVEGAPFAVWARTSAPTQREVLLAFAATCRAIDAAHRRGVLHRDLKSSNVLVDGDGVPHVLDFGLAARWDTDEPRHRLTLTGEFMGTLAYASPEHVAGDPAAIDVRSDVYSLGVLAFEALTGHLPLDDRGATHVVARRIATSELDLRPLGALPVDLATILRTALAADPDRRYATAGAVADDVERFLAGHAIDARRDSAAYVLRKAVARHRVAFAVAGAFVAVAVVAAIVSTTQLQRAVDSRRRAEIEAERASELSHFWRGLFAAIDPDDARGRRYDVRDVLDEAARKMAAAPPRSPAAELELCASIGRTYSKLGYDELAWPHLHRAAALARDVWGAGDVRTKSVHADAATVALLAAPLADARAAVEALRAVEGTPWGVANASAQLALRAGDTQAALDELRAGLAALAVEPAPDLVGACGVLSKMVEIALARGELAAAEELARAALPLAERRGAEELLALGARYQLGVVLDLSGQQDEALPLLSGVVEAFERYLGRDEVRTLTARAVATLVRSRGAAPDAARAELRALLHEVTRLEAEGTAHAATALGAIGQLALGLGDLSRAAACHEAQLRVLASFHAEGSLAVRNVRVQLAECSIERNDGVSALAHATHALEIPDARTFHRLVARAYLARAAGHVLLGEPREAAADLSAAREAAAQVPDDPRLVLAVARNAALIQACSGDLESAERTLREGLEGAPPSSQAWATLASDLGDVLLQRFRAGEAEPLLRRALEVRRELLGPQHFETADTANKLGTALFHQRRGPPDLPALWHEALAALEASAIERPSLASVLNNLGAWAQLVERDAAKAEAYLRRGLAVGERVFGPNDPLLATSLANVAFCDQDDGDHGAAAARLRRALGILEARHGAEHPHIAQLRAALAVSERALGAATEGR